MLRQLSVAAAIGFAIFAVLLSQKQAPEPPETIAGRNNTVLFLTTEASGLSNVHVAVTSALIEHYPGIEIHYASFPKLETQISRISSLVRAKGPTIKSNPIHWHELPGPGILDLFERQWGDTDGMICETGAKGYDKKIEDMAFTLAPWEVEEHWEIYKAIADLVDEIDPALIIIDNMFIPAKDFANNNNRRSASICPSGLVELIAVDQPRGALFWKYPACV